MKTENIYTAAKAFLALAVIGIAGCTYSLHANNFLPHWQWLMVVYFVASAFFLLYVFEAQHEKEAIEDLAGIPYKDWPALPLDYFKKAVEVYSVSPTRADVERHAKECDSIAEVIRWADYFNAIPSEKDKEDLIVPEPLPVSIYAAALSN